MEQSDGEELTEKGGGGDRAGSERNDQSDACFHQGKTEINRTIAFGGHFQRGQRQISPVFQQFSNQTVPFILKILLHSPRDFGEALTVRGFLAPHVRSNTW